MNKQPKNDLLRKLGATRKRAIFGIIGGLLLAVVVIWTKINLYDPFAEEFDDLLVFVPDDASFIVFSSDFPTLVKGLEDRPFISQLDRSKNFRDFLASDLVKETQVIPNLRQAYSFLQDFDAQLPFDLKALGDLSGSEVVVSGFAPERGSDDFTFVAALQPESDLALIGANALINPFLCGFVEDDLGASEIEHFNWGVELTFDTPSGKLSVGVARIERALLIGTNIPAIAKMVKMARTESVPVLPPSRMEPGWVWSADASSAINFAARRQFLLDRVGLHKNIFIPMWGQAIASAFEMAFPSFLGKDIYVQLDCAAEANLRIAAGVEQRTPEDLFSKCESLNPAEAQAQVASVVRHLPHHVFAYAALGNHPADLVSFALRERAIVDQNQKELLFAGLAELSSFSRYKQPDGLVPEFVEPFANKLKALFDPGIGFVFFKKERTGTSDHSDPGFACILKMSDEGLVRQFIHEIDNDLKQPFDYYDTGAFDFWRVSKKAFLNDPINNSPGFAIIGDYLVVTNWVRLFTETQDVMAGDKPGMPLSDQLEYKLDDLTAGTKSLIFVDVVRLYAHMDQAKEGWIKERSKVEEIEMFDQRVKLAAQYRLERPAQPESDWVEIEFKAWLRRTRAERDEMVIRRNIERNLDYFRDAFSLFYVEVGQAGPEFRVDVSVAAQENY